MSTWRGEQDAPEFAQLCASIRSVAGMAGPGTATRAPPRRQKVTRREAMIGGGTAAVLAAVAAGAIWLPRGASAHAARIAVLPFQNLGGDPAQDYFSQGLAEELRATLSQSDDLEVAAQTSSESFRDSKATATAMAKALNVAYLIEGSVRRSAEAIRVSTRVVNGRTGFDEWSKIFERQLSDSFAVQSDIAAFVTDALVAGVRKDSPQRIGGTRQAEAFDAYLRGSADYRLAAGGATDLAALSAFDRAIASDPNYAAAHAARSRVLTVIANTSDNPAQVDRYYQQAIAAARRAIEIEPRLAEGYSALGFVLFNGELDARAAAAPYKRSFELGYGNAEILSAYANFAGRTGLFDEAREAIARAQSLDPLNATVFRNAGFVEYSARRYDAAEAQFRSALAINPRAGSVRSALGDIALLRGDANEARDQFDQERNAVARLRGLAIADMKLGDAEAAAKSYNAMLKEGGATVHYQQAQVLAQWGRKDDALAQLEQAYAVRDAGLVRLKNDPLLDPVRRDQRFTRLEESIGFV
jgi:TolB-like protein/Flp pilus assembly protein TadD